jgi:hypothetical protein
VLTNLELDPQSVRMPVIRVRSKKGRLLIDIPGSHFETAFADFTNAAEDFAMNLSSGFSARHFDAGPRA